ncbi:MAG: efflux RND transporter periplasmic adaptor subunit [Cyanobacteria bacterium P01_D01_bin.50]
MKPPESQTKFQKNNSRNTRQSPRWWQRLLLILLPIAFTVGGITILWRLLARQKNSSSSTTVQQAPVSVKIAEVQFGNIKENSEFIASLQSLRSTSLQANIQGKISQIFVKEGSQVLAQTPLLQINSNNQPINISNNNSNNTAVLETTLQLQNARTKLRNLEAQRLFLLQQVRLNQENYEKYSSLAAEGAISRQTKDEYAQKLEAAKTNFNNLEENIQKQQATVSKLEKAIQSAQANTAKNIVQTNIPEQLQLYKVNAPFKGTVANISVKIGDFVNPSTRVATVTQNQPLEVDIPVSLDKKSQLRKGMTVELINSKGENIGTGKVFFISPEVNNNTNTVLVKALFENRKGKMQAGQFARARINWNQHSGLLIPKEAVFRVAGESFVYVAEKLNSTIANSQFRAKQKQVKLGKIIDNKYQEIEGLQPGEKVVVSKLLNIKDGEIVMAQ